MKVAITLDRMVNQEKPTGAQAALITKRLRKTELAIGEFAPLLVSPYGFSFTPAVYSTDGTRNNKHWLSQQLFAIDIDSNLSFEKALARATDLEIPPSFVYATFSSNETNNKFRLIWVMSEIVTDTRVREIIQAQLMAIYPEADPSCKDAARLFYGGRRLIYQNFDSVINLQMLNFAFDNFVREHEPVNASRNIARFAKKHAINTVNGMLEMGTKNGQNGRNDPHAYSIYNKREDGIFQNEYIFNEDGKSANIKTEPQKLLQRVDFIRLADECNVFADFMQGIDIHHSVTWMVMCSLLRIEGGEKIFWKGLRLRDEYDEVKWQRLIRYWRATGEKYTPGFNYISDFYENDSIEFSNLYQVAASQFGRARLVEAPEYVSLETAEANFVAALDEAIADTANRFFVIKAQVGLGKTQGIIDAVKMGKITHAVIAVPRHDLKDEFAERFLKRGIVVQVTPELPEGPWTPILEALYAKGAFSEAHKQLEKLATTTPAIKEYTSALRSIRDEGIIITTHARLNYFKTSAKLTIIDEDKLLADMSAKTLSNADLAVVTEAFRPTGFRPMGHATKTSVVYDALLKFSDLVRSATERPKVMFSMTELKQSVDLSESMREIESAVVKAKVLGNVMEFLTADFLWVEFDAHKLPRIHFLAMPTFPAETTVVMLSATAEESICKKFFKDRLKFIDVGFVKTRGTVLWKYAEGLSRSAIKTCADAIKTAISKSTNAIISYKSLKALLGERISMTFGALTGMDSLKGQDLDIFGVPHRPMSAYIFAAAVCGEDVVGKENLDEMTYELDIWNGHETQLMMPKAHCLRDYQRWMVLSELDQAVGRSRPLRESTTTTAYGNVPPKGATLVK